MLVIVSYFIIIVISIIMSRDRSFSHIYIYNYDLNFAQIWGNSNAKHRNNGFIRKLFQTITIYFIRFELLFTVSNYLTYKYIASDYTIRNYQLRWQALHFKFFHSFHWPSPQFCFWNLSKHFFLYCNSLHTHDLLDDWWNSFHFF